VTGGSGPGPAGAGRGGSGAGRERSGAGRGGPGTGRRGPQRDPAGPSGTHRGRARVLKSPFVVPADPCRAFRPAFAATSAEMVRAEIRKW
jgi:hypothetical protein